MSKLIVLVSAVLVILATGLPAAAQQPISPYFFGLSMSGGEVGTEPWPVANFTGARLWDSGAVAWSQINVAPGVYDYRQLDIWMNKSEQNGADLLYCFGRTPTWASSFPTDKTCGNEPGSCDAPDDLNLDGTGTDQHWKDFVTAIATHSAGRIHYWELWDEYPNPFRWNWSHSTMAQLVRMAADARRIIKAIDPSAVIVSDSGSIRYPLDVPKWQQFISAGGLNYADILAIHGYVQPSGNAPPEPETLSALFLGSDKLPWGASGFAGFLQQNGYSGATIWDTEGSWAGNIAGLHDPDMRAGFAIRFNVLHESLGIQRFYWYEWNNSFAGTLWQPFTRSDLVLPNANGSVSTMLGFGDGSFQHAVNHGVGSNPAAVAVGDFNNDRIADFVVANQGSNDVSVLLGNGDGTFKAGMNSNARNSPVAIAVGDFNKDGNLDAVVVNGGSSNTVSAMLGNGNGTFRSPASFSVGTNPSSVAVGDFNNDGYPDLVVTNAGSNTVSVLLNNGSSGGFAPAVPYNVGNGPSSVAVGDFNNDGYQDLAVANSADGTVSVLLNNQNGTFATAVPYGAHLNPSAVAVGHFTSSKIFSLAVANQGSNDVSLLIGNGDGTFASAANFAVGVEPISIAVRDVDGNGLPDVVTANLGDSTVTTLLACGLGKGCKGQFFRPLIATPVGSTPISMAGAAFGVIGSNDPGVLLKGGFGYQASYNWTVGNTISTACSGPAYPLHGDWTCGLTGPGGYQAQIVWDSSQTCNANVCTYSNYTAPSQYVQYRTAYGQTFPIQNHTVPIGYVPILLENHNKTRQGLSALEEADAAKPQIPASGAGSAISRASSSSSFPAKLVASDGTAGSFFGNAVSTSEDGRTVAIGAFEAQVNANDEQGAVYVFFGPKTGWKSTKTFAAKLTASDGAAGDSFGESIAMSSNGTVIAVGAPQAMVNGNAGQGAIYVFIEPKGGWKGSLHESGKLTASHGAANDWLGSSVAMGSFTIVSGAYTATVGSNQFQGAAYVFVKPTSGWKSENENAILISSDGQKYDLFGYSVGVNNDTVAVGAVQASVGGNPQSGAAYVFVKPTGGWKGTLTQNAKLAASDGRSEDLLGYSIVISQDATTIASGAAEAWVSGNGAQGAAYLFVKPSGGWNGAVLNETAKLTASDGAQEDYFGTSVAFNFTANTIIIGAPLATDTVNGPGPGKAYIFDKPVNGGWTSTSVYTAELTATDGKPGDELGISVALSNNTAVAGAGGDCIPSACLKGKSNQDQGGTYITGSW